MRRYVKPTRSRQASGRTSERADPTVGMSARERARWDRLRAWRSETAKSDGVPAYVIFHDATLAEIARSEPESLEDLRQIPGMGARKLDRFGADLLEVVAADLARRPAIRQGALTLRNLLTLLVFSEYHARFRFLGCLRARLHYLSACRCRHVCRRIGVRCAVVFALPGNRCVDFVQFQE